MQRTSADRSHKTGRLTRVAMVIATVAIFLLAVAGPAYRWNVLPLLPALLGAAAGFALFVLAFVIGAIGVLVGRRRQRDVPRVAIALIICAGIATIVTGVWITRLRGAPPIHDITTDLLEPPEFKAILPLRQAAHAANPADYRHTDLVGGLNFDISAAQRRAYPDVRPLDLAQTPAQALQLADRAARKMKWRVVAVVPDEGRLEATDTTFYFGFSDDIVVRVRPAAAGSRVDVRSESRVGLGDAGTNARRVVNYLFVLHSIAASPSSE
jgi:uncharacterized protein (DUF1499 family)